MTTYNTSGIKSRTRFIPILMRILLGLLFTVTGLNGFLNFLPMPTNAMPAGALAFSSAMMATGYLFKLVAATQLLSGVLLVTGIFVPFALILLAPVVVNIFAFHAFLDPSGMGIAIFVSVFEVLLAWIYRKSFAPLFKKL